jgi:hypothetical protein
LSWLFQAANFFSRQNLPVRAFATLPEGLTLELPRDFTSFGAEHFQGILTGGMSTLGLYASAESGGNLMAEWSGLASLYMKQGAYYLGIEQSRFSSVSALLQTALVIGRELPKIGYGIGYVFPRARGPDFYTGGIIFGTKFEGSRAQRDAEYQRITAWGHEMIRRKRYLTGMFRGAYPASILSKGHINAVLYKGFLTREVTLRVSGLGRLTLLAQGCWLWELSESEIPEAEEALDKAGLLIK